MYALPVLWLVASIPAVFLGSDQYAFDSARSAEWFQFQIAKLQDRVSTDHQGLENANAALTNAQQARDEALKQGNLAALDIAKRAIAVATEAMEKWKALEANDRLALSHLDAAEAINEECNALRRKAARDREALHRQLKASKLVSEASSGEGVAIEARTGMVAIKVAKLATEFNEVTRTVTEVAEIVSDAAINHPKRPLVLAALGGLGNAQGLVLSWQALKLGHKIEECSSGLRSVDRESALLEKGTVWGTCAKNMAEVAGTFTNQAAIFKKLGDILAVPVDVVDIASSSQQLYEELLAVDDYVRKYPDQALEAERRLDELQKSTLDQIGACQRRVIDVFAGGSGPERPRGAADDDCEIARNRRRGATSSKRF